MTPRRLLASLLALAVASFVTSGPGTGAAARSASCARAKSKTIAANRHVRVYETRGRGGTTLYGCRRSTGRRVELDQAADDGYVSSRSYRNVRLAGLYVAWVSTSTDVSCKADCPPNYDATSTSIEVQSVRRRRSRFVAGAEPLGKALVVTRTGAVAWAARASGGGPVEVRASVRRGDNRLLDSGNIDPTSLAVEITIVSWKRDGVERFARLR